MKLFFVILSAIALISIMSVLYVCAIDDMNEQHPDYKGDDFLNNE